MVSMSLETQFPMGANSSAPPPVPSAGLDDLWQIDPLAKAVYSDNPGFTKGIHGESIPVTAETSMFAIVGPENGLVSSEALVEAAEAAYFISLHPAEAKAKELERPIDSSLAFTGLQWLKEQALGRKDSPQRRNINRAHARLKGQEETRLARQQTGESYASAISAAQQTAGITAAGDVSAEFERQKEQQAAYRARFEQTVAAKIEGVETKAVDKPLDPSSFFLLSRDLVISQGDDGLHAQEGRSSYQGRIAKRVRDYLLDPQEMANDLIIAKLVDGDAVAREQARGTEQEDPSHTYTNKIMCDVLDAALKAFYGPSELSPAAVRRWTDMASRLDGSMTSEELLAQTKVDNDAWALLMVMSTSREILSASLRKVAAEQPRKFVDALYMTAEAGLDPENRSRTHMTIRVIEESLDPEQELLGGHILSASSGAINNVELRQKALDLQVTLYDLGVSGELLGVTAASGDGGDTVSITTLDGEQSKVVRRLTPSAMVRPKDMDRETFQANLIDAYHRFLQEFWDYVSTPEGSSNTLLGRFLEHKRKTTSPIVVQTPEDTMPTLIRSLLP